MQKKNYIIVINHIEASYLGHHVSSCDYNQNRQTLNLGWLFPHMNTNLLHNIWASKQNKVSSPRWIEYKSADFT